MSRCLITATSIVVVTVAVVLTIGGAGQLVGQVLDADSFKAGLITLVLDLGLVLVGPALLLAYVNLMPPSHLPRALETARIGAFATRSKAERRRR